MHDAAWAASQGSEASAFTLPGCLVLRFAADGRCEELREHWHVEFGGPVRPPTGWGH